MNDTALGTVAVVASVTTGIFGSLIGGILGSYYSDYSGLLYLIGFLAGYGIADVITETLNSIVVILLLCVCEDTSIIANRVPALETFIQEKYSKQCSDLFGPRK